MAEDTSPAPEEAPPILPAEGEKEEAQPPTEEQEAKAEAKDGDAPPSPEPPQEEAEEVDDLEGELEKAWEAIEAKKDAPEDEPASSDEDEESGPEPQEGRKKEESQADGAKNEAAAGADGPERLKKVDAIAKDFEHLLNGNDPLSYMEGLLKLWDEWASNPKDHIKRVMSYHRLQPKDVFEASEQEPAPAPPPGQENFGAGDFDDLLAEEDFDDDAIRNVKRIARQMGERIKRLESSKEQESQAAAADQRKRVYQGFADETDVGGAKKRPHLADSNVRSLMSRLLQTDEQFQRGRWDNELLQSAYEMAVRASGKSLSPARATAATSRQRDSRGRFTAEDEIPTGGRFRGAPAKSEASIRVGNYKFKDSEVDDIEALLESAFDQRMALRENATH